MGGGGGGDGADPWNKSSAVRDHAKLCSEHSSERECVCERERVCVCMCGMSFSTQLAALRVSAHAWRACARTRTHHALHTPIADGRTVVGGMHHLQAARRMDVCGILSACHGGRRRAQGIVGCRPCGLVQEDQGEGKTVSVKTCAAGRLISPCKHPITSSDRNSSKSSTSTRGKLPGERRH